MAQKRQNSKKTTKKRGPLTEAAKLRRRQRMQAKRNAEQTEAAPAHVMQADPLIQHSLPTATLVAARNVVTQLRTIRNPNGFPPFITGIALIGVVVKSKEMPIGEAMRIEQTLISQHRSRGTMVIPDY